MHKKLYPLLLFCFGITIQLKALTPLVDSIPMSDGRKLAADIYIPAGISQGPVILIQTPYNRLLYRTSLPLGIGQNLNTSNYIIVVVDWRGFYGSSNADYPGNPSMGQDGFNCVEWIAQQAWCNGKVGTWGPSALGRVQYQTAAKHPPHLVCICPLVAAPQYDYSEYFPHGALRTEYVEQLGNLGFGLTPFLMQHTLHDVAWNYVENLNFYPDSIAVPCLMIGGWYDHTVEFMLPFFKAIQTQSPPNVQSQHRLLMGPWVHGGFGIAHVGSGTQGQLTYNNAAGWNDSLALLFFDYYLRSQNNNWNNTPAVQYYLMGQNNWQTSGTWPPGGTTNTNFYFNADGSLTNTAPANTTDSLNFNYDPTDPSPTVGGPVLRNDLEQGPYDQAPLVESRNDILMFTTPPLAQDVVLKGQPVVHMKVAGNRYDTDFAVRLTDVYPDGRSMFLVDGVMRMRFRNGDSANDTALMIPGQVYTCTIELANTSIAFLAGHKIRVDITSSDYPRFNRNMNTGGPMYPGNSTDSLVNPLIATNTVYTNAINSSYITLPLQGYTSIADISNTGNFNIYPNPATTLLNVQANTPGNYRINIYNGAGQIVLQQSTAGIATFNVLQLCAGYYVVEVINKNGDAHRQKWLKQ